MKLYMFRTVRLSITRIYSLYTQQWYMSYRFIESFREGPGWKVRKLESCLQTSMTYSIAKCAVNKLLMMDRCETCTVSWQNKICETGASSWFYYKEICYDARSHERKIVCVVRQGSQRRVKSSARGVLQYVCVRVCMSLSVIRCNNNPLHLQRVGIKRST